MDDPEYVDGLGKVFAEAELVLARSESLLQRLRDLGCPEGKLRLNRTPVPLERIPFKERAAPPMGKWRLFQACRLIPKKGLFTTIAALPKVVERWPKLKFVLAGTGPDEKRLREAIAEAGLEDNVELLGWIDQDQLLEQLDLAHVSFIPAN